MPEPSKFHFQMGRKAVLSFTIIQWIERYKMHDTMTFIYTFFRWVSKRVFNPELTITNDVTD